MSSFYNSFPYFLFATDKNITKIHCQNEITHQDGSVAEKKTEVGKETNYKSYSNILLTFDEFLKEIIDIGLEKTKLFEEVKNYLLLLKNMRPQRPTNSEALEFLGGRKRRFAKKKQELAKELALLEKGLLDIIAPSCDAELRNEIKNFMDGKDKVGYEERLIKVRDIEEVRGKLQAAKARRVLYDESIARLGKYNRVVKQILNFIRDNNPKGYCVATKVPIVVRYKDIFDINLKIAQIKQQIAESKLVTGDVNNFLNDDSNRLVCINVARTLVESKIIALAAKARRVYGVGSKVEQWLLEARFPSRNDAKNDTKKACLEATSKPKNAQLVTMNQFELIGKRTRVFLQDLKQSGFSLDITHVQNVLSMIAQANNQLDKFKRQVNKFRDLANRSFTGTNSTGLQDILKLINNGAISPRERMDRLLEIACSRLYPAGYLSFVRCKYRTSAVIGNGRKKQVHELYKMLVKELGNKKTLTLENLTARLAAINGFIAANEVDFVFKSKRTVQALPPSFRL